MTAVLPPSHSIQEKSRFNEPILKQVSYLENGPPTVKCLALNSAAICSARSSPKSEGSLFPSFRM